MHKSSPPNSKKCNQTLFDPKELLSAKFSNKISKDDKVDSNFKQTNSDNYILKSNNHGSDSDKNLVHSANILAIVWSLAKMVRNWTEQDLDDILKHAEGMELKSREGNLVNIKEIGKIYFNNQRLTKVP